MTCSFITRTEKLLNEICLMDVVGSTLNICFLGFNMMTVRQKYVSYCLKYIDSAIEFQQIRAHNVRLIMLGF
jgi:hypothetical protein